MSKTAIFADVHIDNHKRHGGVVICGVNARCRAGIRVLRRALRTADEHECAHTIIAGDLFHTIRPPAQVIAAVQSVLYDTKTAISIVAGNHDMASDTVGDNAIGALQYHARIVDEVVSSDIVTMIPYRMPTASGPVSSWLPQVLETQAAVDRLGKLVVAHFGIRHKDTPTWLADSHDSIDEAELLDLAKKFDVRFVAGHWHQPYEAPAAADPKAVYQVGAACPAGWSDSGWDYGQVLIYDTKGPSVERVRVPGPRFLSIDIEQMRDIEEPYPGCQIYVRYLCRKRDMCDVRAWIDHLILDGKVEGGEAIPYERAAALAAVAAATAAQKAYNIPSAVSAYVDNMFLNEGIDRDVVRKKALEYLNL